MNFGERDIEWYSLNRIDGLSVLSLAIHCVWLGMMAVALCESQIIPSYFPSFSGSGATVQECQQVGKWDIFVFSIISSKMVPTAYVVTRK